MKKGLLSALVLSAMLLPLASFAEGEKMCSRVGSKLIKRQAITGGKIANGTIQPDDFSDGAITLDKLVGFLPVPLFVLSVGNQRDIFDNGDLKLTAKCSNDGSKDQATVLVSSVTDGAIVQGYSDFLNITSASPEFNRYLHYVEANTAALGHDPARRFHAIGPDGSVVQSSLYVAVNVRGAAGCHFGGVLHYTPAA
jgi:hypothetical protein